MIDIHCHVLPGLDDGAPDMDTALEMLRIAEQEGIKEIIATPHYKEGRGCANPEQMKAVLQQVRVRAAEKGISTKLYPGNEIYYCSSLTDKLEKQRICSMNDTALVLIEFSPYETFFNIRNAMEDILGFGCIPILAHAERYQCMVQNTEHVRELWKIGCRIQVNAGTVTGHYGLRAKHFVHRLIKEKLVDFIGTDAHGIRERKPEMQKCAKVLYRKYESNYVDAILFGNAENDLINHKGERLGERHE